MPKVFIPNVGEVAFPDDWSEEKIGVALRQDILPDIRKSGFIQGAKAGLEGLREAYYGTKLGLTGSPEDRAKVLESQKRQEELFQGPGYEDVKEAFKERGVGAGLARTWEAARGVAGQSLPYIAAPAIGAAIAPEALGIAGLSAATTGFAIPSIAQYTGSGMGRQVAEQEAAIARGETPKELSLGKAALASIPATVLDRFALGQTFKGTGLGKLFGQEGREGIEQVARKIVDTGADPSKLKAILAGGGRGIAAEIPNEVGQQILERAQAGLSLTDPEAIREYKEAAFGATLLGGPLGGYSGHAMRGAGVQQAQDWEARAADATKTYERETAAREAQIEKTRREAYAQSQAAIQTRIQQESLAPALRDTLSANLERSLELMNTPEGITEIKKNMSEFFPGVKGKELDKLSVQLDTMRKRMVAQQKANDKYAAESAFTQAIPELLTGEIRPEVYAPPEVPAPEFQLEAQTPTPQMGLELGEPQTLAAPKEVAKIDDQYLRGFGLDKRSATYKALHGLDLNNPTDVAEARNIITAVLEGKPSNTQAKVDEMLRTDPRFQEQPELAGFPTEEELNAEQAAYDQSQAEAARAQRNQGLAQLLASLETENAAKEEAARAAAEAGQPSAGVPSEVGVQDQPVGLEPSVDVYDTTGGRGAPEDRGIGGGALGAVEQPAQARVEDAGEAGDTLDFAQMMAEAEAEADRQIAAERAAKEQAAPAAPQTQADFESLLAAEGMPAELGAEEGFEEIPVEYETDEQERERRAQEKAEYDELYGPLKFSEGRPESGGTDVKDVTAKLRKLFASPARFGDMVNVVQSADELPDVAKQELSQAKDPSKVQAFVGNDGKVYLIADNITSGEELGVFLHELGAHVGMEGLIGPANVRALTAQIMKWGDSGANTLEAQIAQRALARAEQSSSQDKSDEAIAYFVEEAVKAGVDPVAVQELNNPLGRWFRKLWAAAKVGLRKIGMGKIDQLTAQNIVDLAYGAAHLELSGTWHGTAAEFRKFNHEYMGTGEGAQAFGWGTYLAQRPGIAKEYWRADVSRKAGADLTSELDLIDLRAKRSYAETMLRITERDYTSLGNMLKKRKLKKEIAALTTKIDALEKQFSEKPEGSLMRTSINVADNELLNWYKPLSRQSDRVQAVVGDILTQLGVPNINDVTGADLLGTTYNPGILPRAIAEGRIEQAKTGTHPYRAASEYLDSLGIKGVIFSDATSRYQDSLEDLKYELDQLKSGLEEDLKNATTEEERQFVQNSWQDMIDEKQDQIKNYKEKPITNNLVIFNDKNIVRAVSYKGAEKSKVKFSEADDILSRMGRTMPEEDTRSPIQRAKEAITNFTPSREKAKSLPRKLADGILNALDASEPLMRELRKEIRNEMPETEANTAIAQLSLSQNYHDDGVADLAMQEGGVAYDPDTGKFKYVKSEYNLGTLAKQYSALATNHNLTIPQARYLASTALESKRVLALMDAQPEQLAKADMLEAKGAKKQAQKIRDKWEKAKFQMTREEAQTGMELFEKFPEIKDIEATKQGMRSWVTQFMKDTGLWSEDYAEWLMDNSEWIPFNRVFNEEEERQTGINTFIRGLQVASKEKKLKWSTREVNDVMDNFEKWMQYAIKRAVRNDGARKLADAAVKYLPKDQAQIVPKIVEANRDRTIYYNDEGVQKYLEFDDPAKALLFKGRESYGAATLPYIGALNNLFRASILNFPLFPFLQVTKDSFDAMMQAGLPPKQAFKMPLRAIKEMYKTLRGTSDTQKHLRQYAGVIDVKDYNAMMARADADIHSGLKKLSAWKKYTNTMQNLNMVADNSIRQAVYELAKESGLSEAEAVEKAFEIINFRTRLGSRVLTNAARNVVFLNAFFAATRVMAKAALSEGISPADRKKARTQFFTNMAWLAGASMLYTLAMGDDDGYEKLSPEERASKLVIPGTGGWGIPIRMSIATLPKTLAEAFTKQFAGQAVDDTKFRQILSNIAVSSTLSGPLPVPQPALVGLELATNYSFFQGRPIVGAGMAKREAYLQSGSSTSELSKGIGEGWKNMVESLGMKSEGVSPMMVDHAVRGMLGMHGAAVLLASNYAMGNRPAESINDMVASLPGLGMVSAKEFDNAAKTDVYDFIATVDKAVTTANVLKTPETAEEFRAYVEKNAEILKYKQAANQIQNNLSKIRQAIKQVSESSRPDREAEIQRLREMEQRYIKNLNITEMRIKAGL